MLLIPGKMVARTVRVGGDVRLDYVDQGDPHARPVVLLHGVTDSWPSFTSVLAHLPESVRAIAVSLRGHGDSTRPASGYAMTDFAGDIRAVLDALAIPRGIVVGHSMGSLVAQRFAIAFPDRTAGLVLMGSTPAAARNAIVRQLWTDAVSTMTDPVDRAFVTAFQQSTVARPTPAGLIDAAVQESLKVPARVWRASFEAMLTTDHSADLYRIAAPTLIAWGTRDAIFGRDEQIAMQAAIPNSRVLPYAGGGHAFHWEDPFRFAADLAAFHRSL